MAISRSFLFASALFAIGALRAEAQTQPSAVPVPFVTAAVGTGSASSTVCASNITSTDGSNFGDGCPPSQAVVNAPQGVAVDSYGNIYFADYLDKQVRVLYKGGAQLAAAITAANSGYAISSSRSAPATVPVAGNVYTLAGVGANTATINILGSGFPCANYNTSGQPVGIDMFGDGCPAASAPVGPRDVKLDSDGNLFLVDYTNARLRIFCVNCAAGTMAQKLITVENPTVTKPADGAMYTLAGWAAANVPATASASTGGYRDGFIGYNTAANTATSAALSIALLREPTGIAISANDDIYIADNLNNALRVLYNGGTAAKNILVAQKLYTTPTVGYVYTIAGSNCNTADGTHTGTVSGTNSCRTTTGNDTPVIAYGTTATTGVGTGPVWSTFLDANNNVFYTDATNQRIKVIYGGIANPLTLSGTLQTGYTYSFAGQGAGTPGAQNGVAPSSLVLGSAQSIGGDANGNLFFFDYSTGYLYEVYAETGIAAILGGNNVALSPPAPTPAAGVACNGLAGGPAMIDAFYNGCPATQAKLASPRGPVVADANGNLYFGDATTFVVRSFSYNQTFPSTPVSSSVTQPYAFTFIDPLTVASSSITPFPDFADGGNSTCNSGVYLQNATCVVNVKLTPSLPSERYGSVELSSATGVAGFLNIGGLGAGSSLLVSPGTITTPATGYTANGVAVDTAGNVYLTDTTSKSAVKVSGGTATAIATGFKTPQGIAVDAAGNVFIADSGANTVTEVPVIGTKFVLSSSVSAPSQLAIGADGTLYAADTGNNRILAFSPGSNVPRVLPFTGLTAPAAVAVDGSGNVYTASGTSLFALAPNGTQTTRSGAAGITWLAIDASGTLYATTGGANATAYPRSGAQPSVYTGTTLQGIALDGSGSLYISDTTSKTVIKSQRTAGYYKFPATSGSVTIDLLSAGTQPVTSTAYTSTNTTDYMVTPSTSNGCSGALPSASGCNYNAAYSQVTLGAPTDTLTFSGGTTFTLASISLTPAIVISANPSTVTYGNSVTLSATVYGPNNVGGTVTIYANGTSLATVTTDANGLASYTYTPGVGSYTITASYTSATTPPSTITTGSTGSVMVSVHAATPNVSLQVTPPNGYTSTSFTASATVTATGGQPTGTVTFFSGATQVGSGTLNASGLATATFNNLPVGTDCITAQYNGDSNYNKAATACTNVSVAAGFSVAASTTQLSFQPTYQEAQTFLSITTGGRTDTLTFTCSNLPSKLQCAFSPASVTLAGGSATLQVQMLVANSAATYGRVEPSLFQRGKSITLALVPLLGGITLLGLRRRRRFATFALTLISLAFASAITGCGKQDPTTLNVPSGTYNFSVGVMSGSNTLQTIPFTLTVP